MRKWWVGTFQQIVEFITNFGYNITYRELCWIINGFNSKWFGNNFYQSVALNPIHKWIFLGEKILSSWVPVKVEVLFMRVHQLHFGLLQGPQPPVVVPSPGSLYIYKGTLRAEISREEEGTSASRLDFPCWHALNSNVTEPWWAPLPLTIKY